MKRRLLIIVVCLALGAVVNVAVAWGFAVIVTKYRTVQLQTVERDGWREVFVLLTAFGSELVVPTSTGAEEAFGMRVQRLSPSHSAWGVARRGGPESSMVVEEASGWPGLCLRWYSSYQLHGGLNLGGISSYTIVEDNARTSVTFAQVGDRTIPLIPIWPGFAVNTLFYAAILWLLIPGPFALRRFLRLRRGLCPKCAYPMGESAVCSECGVELPSRPAAT